MKKKLSKTQRALSLVKNGVTPAQAARRVGIDASNLYRFLEPRQNLHAQALEPGEDCTYLCRPDESHHAAIMTRNHGAQACVMTAVHKGRKLIVTLEWPK